MGWEVISVSREELYEKVWAQPMTKLAKEYGLSDVGLSKICKKLKVPRPPQGYWVRKKRGTKPALPPTDGPTEHAFQKYVKPELELDSAEKAERAKLIECEKQPEYHIHVPESLDSLHPLASRALLRLRKEAAKKNITDDSWVFAGAKCLNVCVSPPLIDRAMSIMNALVRALNSRKFKVVIEEGETFVTVMGEKLLLNLEETSRRIEHEPTPQEIKQQKEFSWMTPPKYDYLPSGKLSLKIDKNSYGQRTTLNDGKKKRIEEHLNSFVISLIEAAYREKSKRAEAERREREWKGRERLRAEKATLIREENARVEQLEADADTWHRSQQIRNYIEAVRKDAIAKEGEIDPDGDLAKWISWATQQADRLDPSKESPPSVLDER